MPVWLKVKVPLEALAGDREADAAAGDHQSRRDGRAGDGLPCQLDVADDGAGGAGVDPETEGAGDLHAGHGDRHGAGDRARQPAAAQDEGTVAAGQRDQPAAEAQPEVGDREHGDDRGRRTGALGGALEGDVAGERLAGDRQHHAGGRDPQVGAGRQVQDEVVAAHGHGLVDDPAGAVDGQLEGAGDLDVRREQPGQVDGAGELGGEAARVGRVGGVGRDHHQDAVDVAHDGRAAEGQGHARGGEHGASGAGRAGRLLHREGAGQRDAVADGEDEAAALDPEVRSARDPDPADLHGLGAGVDRHGERAGQGGRAQGQRRGLGGADREVAGDARGARHQVAGERDRADAGEREGRARQGHRHRLGRGDGVGDLGEAEGGDGEHLAGQRHRDAGAGHGQGAGGRVDGQPEGADDGDGGQVDVDRARDRADDPGGGDVEARGPVGQADDRRRTAAEGGRDVAQPELGERRRTSRPRRRR